MIRLEDLNLVIIHQKDAGVAAHLRALVGKELFWIVTVFDMKLTIAELLTRINRSAVFPVRHGIKVPFFGIRPFGGSAVLVAPIALERL